MFLLQSMPGPLVSSDILCCLIKFKKMVGLWESLTKLRSKGNIQTRTILYPNIMEGHRFSSSSKWDHQRLGIRCLYGRVANNKVGATGQRLESAIKQFGR